MLPANRIFAVSNGVMEISAMSGLDRLWNETLGDPRVRVAILDGPVCRAHPAFRGASLTPVATLVQDQPLVSAACQHGTHVASIIFGQHEQSVMGIAPRCSGLLLPVFEVDANGSIMPCSQLDLARAILQAVDLGAQIINISGGELSDSGIAQLLLADAVQYCVDRNVLVVAAAGNEGCDCMHLPAALPSVLMVGATNAVGIPLHNSNWGALYESKGILAPGEMIRGAACPIGVTAGSGTSFATAIVSGIAALMLSLQLKLGKTLDPCRVKSALLETAFKCEPDSPAADRRWHAGRLNIAGTMENIIKKEKLMSNSEQLSEIVMPARHQEVSPSGEAETKPAYRQETVAPGRMYPSECNCHKDVAMSVGMPAMPATQIVYALGTLGYDFSTEQRRDSFAQHMDANPQDQDQLLSFLDKFPWEAENVTWLLKLESVPIYAIQPRGPFAGAAYKRLQEFLREQTSEGVDRVSLPGLISGQMRLLSGQVVPVVVPDLRCMYSWATPALIKAVSGEVSAEATDKEKKAFADKKLAVTNFLDRVYYELRNLGITPQERALNYAATNVMNVDRIFATALTDQMELESIATERSPISRMGSESWDIKLVFFSPGNLDLARKVYRFTVDVTDVCPVMVGKTRAWSVK